MLGRCPYTKGESGVLHFPLNTIIALGLTVGGHKNRGDTKRAPGGRPRRLLYSSTSARQLRVTAARWLRGLRPCSSSSWHNRTNPSKDPVGTLRPSKWPGKSTPWQPHDHTLIMACTEQEGHVGICEPTTGTIYDHRSAPTMSAGPHGELYQAAEIMGCAKGRSPPGEKSEAPVTALILSRSAGGVVQTGDMGNSCSGTWVTHFTRHQC